MWAAPALRLLRVANPLVRAVLGSRAHHALSGRLVVLEYRGPRTGRTFRIPLRYVETADGGIVAVAVRPERKKWWRTFTSDAPATLTFRGAMVGVRGRLVSGETRVAALEAYLARYPGSGPLTADAAVVVFRPVDG